MGGMHGIGLIPTFYEGDKTRSIPHFLGTSQTFYVFAYEIHHTLETSAMLKIIFYLRESYRTKIESTPFTPPDTNYPFITYH